MSKMKHGSAEHKAAMKRMARLAQVVKRKEAATVKRIKKEEAKMAQRLKREEEVGVQLAEARVQLEKTRAERDRHFNEMRAAKLELVLSLLFSVQLTISWRIISSVIATTSWDSMPTP